MSLPHDPSIRSVLAAKLADLLDRRERLKRDRDALDARGLLLDREMADLRAAARLFQVQLDWPKAEGEEDRHLRSARVFFSKVAGNIAGPSVPPPVFPSPAYAPKKTIPVRPPIKNIVLDRLRAAGEEGSKAAPIRKHIEQVYDTKVHEKTVGMTLYRLSKEGLVRRKGQIWFFVPQTAETENPGVVAPGSESSGK